MSRTVTRVVAGVAALLVAGFTGCAGQPPAGTGPAGPAGTGPARTGPPAGHSSGPASPLSGSITVFAAASLTGSFTALGERFQAAHPGTSVRFNFAASSTLAQQISAGAPADVFASASTRDMTRVVEAGQAAAPRTFATNSAEIAVAAGQRARVRSIRDLGRPGVTVALCQSAAPCGALADRVLAASGVTVHPVTRGLNVKATLAYVTSGEVDAALVYVTDLRAAGQAVTGVAIPQAANASTAYPIAVLRDTANDALAAAFERFVLSPAGRTVLAADGFGAP